MTPKKNYSRYFIILQEDEKGYSLNSDKIPSGYAKLEMKNSKCKVSYYVQNLRKEKQPYYMVLICGKKDVNKIIKVGKLNIDDHGRVDTFFEYDMENIAESNISSEKIIGAAIVKFLDTNVISIMSGFSTTDKPSDWKNYKLADGNKEKKETRAEDVVNEFDEYEQSIELIKVKTKEADGSLEVQNNVDERKDQKQRVNSKDENVLKSKKVVNVLEELDNVINDDYKEIDSKQRNEYGNIEQVEIRNNVNKEVVNKKNSKIENVDPIDTNKNTGEKSDDNQRVKANSAGAPQQSEENIESDNEQDIYGISRNLNKDNNKDNNKEYDSNEIEDNYSNEDNPKGDLGNFFKAVAQDFEKVPDFTKEIKWCTWYKVPVNELENMYKLRDYNKYTIAYYPMICYYPYIRNYKSYMLGYKCDSSGKMKYIVYGIPGTKAKAHQPYGGKTGFVTWISDKENDEMGHWLMFYDFKNSTIVVPIKK